MINLGRNSCREDDIEDDERRYKQAYLYQDMHNYQSNPELGITFGKQQTTTTLFNQIFTQPPTKIHSSQRARNLSTHKLKQHPNNHLNLYNRLDYQQLQQIKQNMTKISYSIKTIQSRNDEQIGISSRRVLMKTKELENERMLVTFRRNRSKSSHDFINLIKNDEQAQQGYQTQRVQKENNMLPHSRFFSKRLNVIVKMKSASNKLLQSNLNVDPKIYFENIQEQDSQKIDNSNQEKNNVRVNKISHRHHKSYKAFNVQNKRLKYEKLIMQNQQKIKSSNPHIQSRPNLSQNLALQQTNKHIFLPQQPTKLSQRTNKISLSNLLSQYHTQMVQNKNNLLMERNNLCQPLKEILKNKFSSRSKYHENDVLVQKNVFKIKLRKNSHSLKKEDKKLLNKKFNQNYHQMNDSAFKRYQQIEKQNLRS